ncbi:reticulon-1-A-like isoform X2 [Gigantopelta aegis]|uniref:reticulon-1-A-like isoform X2 n=1 Tax=Gigantopelta aegis TaxID=1735272 RepID=UPI001B88A8BD|nr:reticulon-1-A-like isoform X2 [Gigantopelta aegis]
MTDFPSERAMDSPSESNNLSSDDFEQVDRPKSDAGDGHGDFVDQDEEVTSSSMPGEEKAEEDLYVAGASEAEPLVDPLISFGDESSAPPLSKPIQAESDPQEQVSPSIPESSYIPPSTTQEPTPPVTPELIDFVEKTESKDDTEPKEVKPKDAWLKNIDPRVLELIYWRDVRKTGMVFGSMIFILLSLAYCSLLSVLAYLSLAMLTVTLTFRVYKNIMSAVQKTGEGHPFKKFLEMEIDLPEDKVQKAVQNILKHVNCTAKELRRLFLIEDLVDSIKFGLLLWVLTYVGSWFNGMTLIILGVVSIFTLPKVYETYKVQIDNYMGKAQTQIDKVLAQVQAKLPFLKKKTKTQ